MFFNRYLNYPIGLDISDLSLKAVQLDKGRSSIKFQAISKVDLPEGYIVNGEIINKEMVIKSIHKLLSNPRYGKITTNEVVVCLPETKTFIKLIEIERSLKPLSSLIKNEIIKYIPLTIDEIYYDWQLISEDSLYSYVLIGASPKNIVDDYILVLNEAHLSVSALEIEPISICRALLNEEGKNKNEISNNYCLVDIGARRTGIIIYSKNTILFSSSLPISGNEITKKIAENLNISKIEAEKLKINASLNNNDIKNSDVNKILTGMFNILIKKLKEIINFYNNEYEDRGAINKIILCGGGANMADIDKKISSIFSINTILGNCFENFSIKNKNKDNYIKNFLKDSAPIYDKTINKEKLETYTTAVGLALREIFIDEF